MSAHFEDEKTTVGNAVERLRAIYERLHFSWLNDPKEFCGYKAIADELNAVANDIESAWKRERDKLVYAFDPTKCEKSEMPDHCKYALGGLGAAAIAIENAENRLLRMSARDLWGALTSAGLACETMSGSEVAYAVYALQILAQKVESCMIENDCKTVGDFFAEARKRKLETENKSAKTRQRSAADSGCPNVLRNTDVIIAQSAPVGNAAAMREALKRLDVLNLVVLKYPLDGDSSEIYDADKKPITLPAWGVATLLNGAKKAQDMARAALSMPPRNCDIPSVCDDPHKAYLDDEKNWDEWGSPKLEIYDWLLAPAEEGGDINVE